jgi:hypothetical protein
MTGGTYTTVVETGTFKGTTTLRLAERFDRVYTVEIDERLYKMAANKFASKKKDNIVALLGDSREVLGTLVPELCADGKADKVVFWLDAHWAGDSSVDWENSKWKGYGRNTGYTGKGEGNTVEEGYTPTSRQQVPLEEEIMCIFDGFDNECIVYIDDYDQIDPETKTGMGNGKFQGQDWSHLDFNVILQRIESRTMEVKSLGGKQLLIKLRQKRSPVIADADAPNGARPRLVPPAASPPLSALAVHKDSQSVHMHKDSQAVHMPTLVMAVLLAVGGAVGKVRAGSNISMVMGLLFGGYYYRYTGMPWRLGVSELHDKLCTCYTHKLHTSYTHKHTQPDTNANRSFSSRIWCIAVTEMSCPPPIVLSVHKTATLATSKSAPCISALLALAMAFRWRASSKVRADKRSPPSPFTPALRACLFHLPPLLPLPPSVPSTPPSPPPPLPPLPPLPPSAPSASSTLRPLCLMHCCQYCEPLARIASALTSCKPPIPLPCCTSSLCQQGLLRCWLRATLP